MRIDQQYTGFKTAKAATKVRNARVTGDITDIAWNAVQRLKLLTAVLSDIDKGQPGMYAIRNACNVSKNLAADVQTIRSGLKARNVSEYDNALQGLETALQQGYERLDSGSRKEYPGIALSVRRQLHGQRKGIMAVAALRNFGE